MKIDKKEKKVLTTLISSGIIEVIGLNAMSLKLFGF